MGKVWPTTSVAFNQRRQRSAQSPAIDESPLLEGLLYVGTDDGLVQVSDDGGEDLANWTGSPASPTTPT